MSEENNLQSVAQGYYANTEGLMQMERDRAVSYTHLDVYKRQG